MTRSVLWATLAAIVLAVVGAFATGAISAGRDGGGAPLTPPAEPTAGQSPSGGDQPPATTTPVVATPSPDAPRGNGVTPLPPPDSRLATPAPGRMLVLAPIDGLSIVALESYPVRYVLRVSAGLPGGCVRPSGYSVERAGEVVRVSVYNTVPSTPEPCTLVYGQYDLSIDLGSAFAPGREQVIEVNGKQTRFQPR